MSAVSDRLDAIEARLAALEAKLARGRTKDCRKGLDPETCSKSSTYQYQQGCGGAACERKNTAYYSAKAKAARRAAKVVPVKVNRRKKVWSGAGNQG